MARTTVAQSLNRWFKAQHAYDSFVERWRGVMLSSDSTYWIQERQVNEELEEAVEQLELNLRSMIREEIDPLRPT